MKAASISWCKLLGVAKTMDFLMRKRIVPAEEALELGLVHEVVPGDRLEGGGDGIGERTRRWAAGVHAVAETFDLQRRRDGMGTEPG